ncbi:ATP-binding protein [Alcanivorax sp. MD8A]|uniref:DEAD/DEAH box helicase n=1 Tax=Alcanivorax sp. MD8A TaxID=1177157 RepID=UPI001304B9ED|nr:AAA domain-containing protein [Alcanivorax sp. MD8A]
MYLRTRCDKELYFSLHERQNISALGLPEPVKRPGIGTLSLAGKELELERNDKIVGAFGKAAVYSRGEKKFNNIDLQSALTNLQATPSIIIQPKFSVDSFRIKILSNIGVPLNDAPLIPPIADFIPDLLLIIPPQKGDYEVLINGSRAKIGDNEKRQAIKVMDIKHTSESNPSYCAEIAMYSLMLSNWLANNPNLRGKYYVSSDAYLWTLKKQGDSALDSAIHAKGSTQDLLSGLISDCEETHLYYYLATVKQFFEDIARVIRIGDADKDSWKDLDWHVVSSCANCDWLGDKRHLGTSTHSLIENNRAGYCITAAQDSGHLSLIPGITRGAKKTLERDAINNAAALSNSAGHPALQKHTFLKKEAATLPAKANAILNQQLGNDPDAVIASLAGYSNLQLFLSVNFDASAGLLTGMSISGLTTSYTTGIAPNRFPNVAFVVDEKTLEAEWIALEGFLTQISDCIEIAENKLGANNLKGQIHIWEKRQFIELCNAIGRHLPRVLELSNRKTRALVWIFTPEDLVTTPRAVETATVVIIEDIVKRMVFTPTPHVITLFDTAEIYNRSQYNPSVRDPYYREYLSNGIPRERIYEIWSNSPRINRGPNVIPRNNLISDFSDALKRQSRSLQSVCEKLREDYRGSFKAVAPKIPTSTPRGATGVAFDAKLWIWWDELNFLTSQLESHFQQVLEGARLEATYEAIILKNGHYIGDEKYRFDVAATSAEAKFKNDSMLTLGKLGRPGFPLENVNQIISPDALPYTGNQPPQYMPLWSVLSARLVEFDRLNLTATVKLSFWSDPDFIPYLIENCTENLLDDVFLLEPKSPKAFNWANTSSKILREIGNPPIAKNDENAAAAMGLTPPRRQTRNSNNTPAAEVLWDAATPYNKSILSTESAAKIAAIAESAGALNPSQKTAVQRSAEKGLTVIWGPPGTGKTKTLAYLIYAMSKTYSSAGKPLKILVTGPTYKAVEEVIDRTYRALVEDEEVFCDISFGYSGSRTSGRLNLQSSASLDFSSFSFDNNDPGYIHCLENLKGDSGVHIVGSQIRQARRLSSGTSESERLINDVFDLVIIDESSQVPVSNALSALCGLKSEGRLVVAGDDLQMPPISAVEAPADAAYLIGSIQNYLVSRDFGETITPCILDQNYRSAGAIVDFAKTIGYPEELTAVYPNTSLSFTHPIPSESDYPSQLPWCDQYQELLDPDNQVVALLHDDEISSQGNHFEAKLVAGIVWNLRQVISPSLKGRGKDEQLALTADTFWNDCVGIVTPHRAQRALVIRELEELFPQEKNLISEAVDTVERFQGGERHCIIVTYGVADVDVISGEEAFLLQLERTNVAISRAMAKCIVVMPMSLAKHIPEDKKALETAHALKGYLDDFCNRRVDCKLSTQDGDRAGQIRIHNQP